MLSAHDENGGGPVDFFDVLPYLNLACVQSIGTISDEFNLFEDTSFRLTLQEEGVDANNDPLDIEKFIENAQIPIDIHWKESGSNDMLEDFRVKGKVIDARSLLTKKEIDWERSSTFNDDEVASKVPIAKLQKPKPRRKPQKSEKNPKSCKIIRLFQGPAKAPSEALPSLVQPDSIIKEDPLDAKELCQQITSKELDTFSLSIDQWLRILLWAGKEQHLKASDRKLLLSGLFSCINVETWLGALSKIINACFALASIYQDCLEILYSNLDKIWTCGLAFISNAFISTEAVKFIENVCDFCKKISLEEMRLLKMVSDLTNLVKTKTSLLSEDFAWYALKFLTNSTSKFPIISEYVYEHLVWNPSQDVVMPSFKVTNTLVRLNVMFPLVDLACKIIDWSMVKGSTENWVDKLLCIQIFQGGFSSIVERRVEALLSIIGDLSAFCSLPEKLLGILFLKRCYSSLLEGDVMNNLKADNGIRLVELLSSITSQIRKFEIQYGSLTWSNTLEDTFTFISRIVFDPRQVVVGLSGLVGPDATTSEALAKFGPSSDRCLALFIKIIHDSSPILKAKVIRELGNVLSPTDAITSNNNFIRLIQRRISDQSPLVREAAIDLYFKLVTVIDGEVLKFLTERLNDTSLSVRKRLVKIIGSFLSTSEDAELVTIARISLVREVYSNMQSVSDMSFEILLDSWIKIFCSKKPILLQEGDITGHRQLMADFTASIIRIIRSNDVDLPAFKHFFSKALNSKDVGSLLVEASADVIDLLFETLVASVESGNDASVKFILAAIVTLSDASLVGGIEKHFRLLTRLLVSVDSDTIESSLVLLSFCIRKDGNALSRSAPELLSDLSKLVFKGSAAIIRGSLDCLTTLASSSKEALLQTEKIYERLCRELEKCANNVKTSMHTICRSALSIALLVRHVQEKHLVIKAIHVEPVIKLIEQVLRCTPTNAVFTFCTMALMELVRSDPLVGLREDVQCYINDTLEKGESSTKLAFLSGLHEMLKKDTDQQQVSKFTADASGRLDYSTTLCTLIQAYLPRILPLVHGGDALISESTVSLLRSIMGKGLTLPQTIFPFIICVWGGIGRFGTSGKIWSICEETCSLYDQHLSVSFASIIHESYLHNHRANGDLWRKSNGFFSDELHELESYFAPLYDAIKTKTLRAALLNAIFKEIRTRNGSIGYCIFLLNALCSLQIKTRAEVILIARGLTESICSSDLDSDSDGGKNVMIRQLLLIKAKNFFSSAYRIDDSDLAEGCIDNKKDVVPKRFPLPWMDLGDADSLMELSETELHFRIDQELNKNAACQPKTSSNCTGNNNSGKPLGRKTKPKLKKSVKKRSYKDADLSDFSDEAVDDIY